VVQLRRERELHILPVPELSNSCGRNPVSERFRARISISAIEDVIVRQETTFEPFGQCRVIIYDLWLHHLIS